MRGGRAGSGDRISSNAIAETRNDTASTRIANGAETNWTRPPARPGPPISAIDELVASLLLASTTLSVPTSDGTYAGYAASNTEARHASANIATYSWAMVRAPATNATGIDRRIAARIRSDAMSNGRRRRRSTHAPATKPTSSTARLTETTSSAISVGPAPRTRSATRGTAVRVTTLPSRDTVWPVHSFMKSAWRHRVGVITVIGG